MGAGRVKAKQTYHGLFTNPQDVTREFQCELNQGEEILFARYVWEDYCGDAMVIYRQDGQLYEVNGGHCSCNGLEGQWEPEPTTLASLAWIAAKGGKFDQFYPAEKAALLALVERLRDARC